jgi:hypothetical protein
MFVKNLSRHGGGSAPVLRYIFRYVFRDTATTKRRNRRAYAVENDKQTVWERVGYARAMRNAEVRFNRKDIDYLLREKADWTLTRDLLQKAQGNDYAQYIQKYLQASQKENEASPFVMTHNIRPYKSLEDIVRQFEANEAGRLHKRKDSPTVHHTIISFSNKDSHKVTDVILKDVLQEYVRLRGQDILYAIAKHDDKAHIHAHICMSATRTDGSSSRVSKAEFADIKDRLQTYQKEKYPFLEYSLPEHGKKKNALEKGVWKNIRDERSTVKNNLLDAITSIRPKGTKELLEQLEEQGYFAYYRANALTGVRHLESNLKFRFNRIGVDIEELRRLEERTIKEETLLTQIAGIRGGVQERALDMPERLDIHERFSTVVEKDNDALKDMEEIRASREQDDDREREYDTDNIDDQDSTDDEDIHDTDDEHDAEEFEEEEEQELEDDEDEGANDS